MRLYQLFVTICWGSRYICRMFRGSFQSNDGLHRRHREKPPTSIAVIPCFEVLGFGWFDLKARPHAEGRQNISFQYFRQRVVVERAVVSYCTPHTLWILSSYLGILAMSDNALRSSLQDVPPLEL